MHSPVSITLGFGRCQVLGGASPDVDPEAACRTPSGYAEIHTGADAYRAAAGRCQEHASVGVVCAGRLIRFSALQAHMIIDVCEEVLLRSLAAALEMLDKALRCVSVSRMSLLALHEVHDMHGNEVACGQLCAGYSVKHVCTPGVRKPCVLSPAAYSSVSCSFSSKSQSDASWWWVGGDDLYNVYC